MATWLGWKIVDAFWWKSGSDVLEQAGFSSHPKLGVLRPDCSIFETATSFAILNYPTDVLDFVREGQVTMHRKDLARLSDHTIHFKDGTSIDTDASIASTGWAFGPAINFTDTNLHSALGIPSLNHTREQESFWTSLDEKADTQIFITWPKLAQLK
ncbi:hypothetical protein LTR62_001666 [Meristemomyces frigidus]|uniref:Uncharacterized protein n=1 Tax=Meristemomyces frigidus TaxID=1508187 RepID=A0AAN7YBI1_9PEZI|nr:hypothetical protein LTR62_001666 [Meristemomyces frigidus]